MKKYIFIALLMVSALNASIGADKYKHAYVGIGIYAGCMLVDSILEGAGYDTMLNEKTCLIPVAVAGIGKEIYDSQHANHTSDAMDAVATMAIPFVGVTLYSW